MYCNANKDSCNTFEARCNSTKDACIMQRIYIRRHFLYLRLKSVKELVNYNTRKTMKQKQKLKRWSGVLILWMVINTILAADAFDPFPFILLNLVLSCVAAIQAPLIMMSQNRQEEKDRRRAENDYKVNLKTEIMIEDLHDKVNAILAKQSALEKKLQEQEDQTKS